MRVVLLGGSGFIGSNLVEYLIRKKHTNIIVYDIVPSCNLKVKYIKGSIHDIERLEKVIAEHDCVICLSGAGFPNQDKKDIYSDVEKNVLPILKVIQMCMEKKVERFIFSSSGGSVYGVPTTVPINEKHETCPISSYGICKLMIERYLEVYSRLYEGKVIILRVANPYGKYQKPFIGQGIIATYLASAFLNNTVEIWGDGTALRDYVWIEDVVDAFEKAIFYQGSSQIFNIGSGVGYSINDIIGIIERVTNKKMKLISKAATVAEVGKNILDCKLVEEEMNWKAKVDIEDGIKRMCDMWNPSKKLFFNEK